MNDIDKTVTLLNQWAEFLSRNPGAELEDFHRYKLIEQKQARQQQGEVADGILPPEANLLLIKLLHRIDRLYLEYAEVAIEGTGIHHFEEFLFLNAVAHLQEPRKTEVITHTITRLSSGLLIIERLKKYGYIAESDDEEDKRSKRVELTPSGQMVLQNCYEQTSQLGKLFFSDLTEEDMLLCIQLLKSVEIKFSQLWPKHKGKTFEMIQAEMRLS